MLVVALTNFTEMNDGEGSAYTVLKKLAMREDLKKCATRMLMKAYKNSKGHNKKFSDIKAYKREFRTLLNEFKQSKRLYRCYNGTTSNDEITKRTNIMTGH